MRMVIKIKAPGANRGIIAKRDGEGGDSNNTCQMCSLI